MGLHLLLSGDYVVDWVRPVVPALGIVNLSRGLNFVAWSGISDLPIADLLQGVGAPLVQSHAWDPQVQRYVAYAPGQGDAGPALPSISRGGAIWIIVDNDVAWFQGPDRPLQHSWTIRGRLVGFDGAPLVDKAIRAVGADYSDSSTRTTQDGSFAIAAPRNGAYRLNIWLSEGCVVFHRLGGATTFQHEASLVWVSNADVTDVVVAVPPRGCGWRIFGRVIDPAGVGMEDVTISASNDTHGTHNYTTQADGSFDIRVLKDGVYQLWITPDTSCFIYYREGGVTPFQSEGSWVRAIDADAEEVTIRIPRDICTGRIQGRVLASDGTPIAGTPVQAFGPEDVLSDTRTADDGSFSIVVPIFDTYRIQAWTKEHCTIRAGNVDVVPSDDAKANQDVGDDPAETVIDIEITVPPNQCIWQIRGRVVDVDQQGIANVWMRALGGISGQGGGYSGADGSFAITVPMPGEYELLATFGGRCRLLYTGSPDASDEWRPAIKIHVVNSDVTGVVFRIPQSGCR